LTVSDPVALGKGRPPLVRGLKVWWIFALRNECSNEVSNRFCLSISSLYSGILASRKNANLRYRKAEKTSEGAELSLRNCQFSPQACLVGFYSITLSEAALQSRSWAR